MTQSKDDIDLLLIGKTGHGKSTLGNSILGRKEFITTNNSDSVTTEIKRGVGEINGRFIAVYDSPGLTDTKLEDDKISVMVTDAMKKAIEINPKGFHAFLLVTRFGARFTAEEKDVVHALKHIFGDNFVKNYCILVLTGGDLLDKLSFEDWCAEQTGEFKELLDECCNRVILFNNRTKDKDLRIKQVIELIKIVDDLRWFDLRYTDKNFEQALEAQKRQSLESKIPFIQQEWIVQISLIIQKLESLKKMKPEISLQQLRELQNRTQYAYDKIVIQDEETGVLKDLQDTVETIKKAIGDEILIAERIIEETEKLIIEEENKRQFFDEEIKRQREEYEELMSLTKMDEDCRKKLKKEHKIRMKEIEDEIKRKKSEREEAMNEAISKESLNQKQVMEDINKQYQQVKCKNDSVFKSVFNTITLDFKKLVDMKI